MDDSINNQFFAIRTRSPNKTIREGVVGSGNPVGVSKGTGRSADDRRFPYPYNSRISE